MFRSAIFLSNIAQGTCARLSPQPLHLAPAASVSALTALTDSHHLDHQRQHHHCPIRFATFKAEQCIAAGAFKSALRCLDAAKEAMAAGSGRAVVDAIDYLRALCLLRVKEPFKARKALRSELSTNPFNDDARDLLYRVNASLQGAFPVPVRAISAIDPHFKELCEIISSISPSSSVANQQFAFPARLYSLYARAKSLCESESAVEGDFVECASTEGGVSPSAVVMAYVAKHFGGLHGQQKRVILVNASCCSAAANSGGGVAIDEATLKGIEAAVGGRAGSFVSAVSGPFHATLPNLCGAARGSEDKGRVAITRVSLLHLDCEWYDSTRLVLHWLYPRLTSPPACEHISRAKSGTGRSALGGDGGGGGIVQIDDFHYWDGCQRAVAEHIEQHKIPATKLHRVDGNAVWFRKE